MRRKKGDRCEYQVLEIAGVRCAVLPERVLRELCARAEVEALCLAPKPAPWTGEDLSRERLAERLIQRRKRTGLTQAELAKRAGIRVETLNRLERGRTTPDFATVRRLVVAMNASEAEQHPSGLVATRGAKRR